MRRRALVFAMAAVLSFSTGLCFGSDPEPTSGTSNAVQALAFDLAGHPEAEAADLYKFLHQAMFGAGHAVSDSDRAADFLQSEIAALGPTVAGEAWCDTLGGDPFLVRVNLRPFVANGFDPADLVEAFVETAAAIHGDPQQMGVALDLVVSWLSTEKRKDLANALEDLGREMESRGYPAVHHSGTYREAYRPAYRVVAASLASSNGWCGSTF